MEALFWGMLMALSILCQVQSQNYDDTNALLNFLFDKTRYSRNIRPLKDQSRTLQVNFTQYLESIEILDVTSGELSSTGYFVITWYDELLRWDPAQYGGIQNLTLPKELFWKPEITLANRESNKEANIYDSAFTPSFVNNDGLVTMVPAGYFQSKCSVDTTFYPLDQHVCYFDFFCSNHDISEVVLKSPLTTIEYDTFSENNEWIIKSTDITIALKRKTTILKFVSSMSSSITVQRRPAFGIVNTYAGVMLLTVLNICTCFVHPDSGERLSFALSVYLALVVTCTSIISSLPRNSLKISLTSYNVLILNVLNAIGIMWSVFIVNLAKTPKEKLNVPNILMKRIVKYKRKFYAFRNAKSTGNDGEEEIKHSNQTSNEYNLIADNQKETIQQTKEAMEITGVDVAKYLDIIFFRVSIVFSLMIFAAELSIFIWYGK